MKGQKFKASLVKFDSCKKTKELYNNLLRKKNDKNQEIPNCSGIP
jgi:hypothetical protein